MTYINESELRQLREAQTVGDMLTVLTDNFDLSIMPTPFQRTMLISGLGQAVDLLKPIRREKRRKRIIVNHETTN